jgi:hypothetical protein
LLANENRIRKIEPPIEIGHAIRRGDSTGRARPAKKEHRQTGQAEEVTVRMRHHRSDGFLLCIEWRGGSIPVMNVIQRLDLVIELVDAGKPPSDIKGHLVAIKEQVEAYAKDADMLAILKHENAKLISENANLVAKNNQPPAPTIHAPIRKFSRGQQEGI